MSQPNDYYHQYNHQFEIPKRDNGCYDQSRSNCCCCKQLRPFRKMRSSHSNSTCPCHHSCNEDCRKAIMSCLWVGENTDCRGRLPVKYHLETNVSPSRIGSKFGKIISNIKCIAESYVTPDVTSEITSEVTSKQSKEKGKCPCVDVDTATEHREKYLKHSQTSRHSGMHVGYKYLCGLVFILAVLLFAWYYNKTLDTTTCRGYTYRR